MSFLGDPSVGMMGDSSLNPLGVDFDGSNDSMARGADLTGCVDGRQGIFSCWFRKDGGDGAQVNILNNTPSYGLHVKIDSSNILNINIRNSAVHKILGIVGTTAITAGATWRHILASWDTNYSAGNKKAHLYLDGVDDLSATTNDDGAAEDIDYVQSNWVVGNPVERINGCLSDLYFSTTNYLDFSVEANRRLFINSLGRPVDLGSDGSVPTSSVPIVYLSVRNGQAATDFATNRGSGGDFTITGSLDLSSTNP